MTLEDLQDLLGSASFVSANANLTIAYEDVNNRWLFTVPGGGSEATTVSDTATLDLVLSGVDIHGNVLDSPLLGGQAGAFYLARGNHTGTQLAATISDLNEAIEDQLGYNDFFGTATINVTYDDALHKFTWDIEPSASITWTGVEQFHGIGTASVSTGGSVQINPDAGTGAGLIVYSNRGADAAGRLVHVFQDNALNPQTAMRVLNDGTGFASSVVQTNPAGNEALDIDSLSTTTTAVGVSGDVKVAALVKLTHRHASGASDDSAAAILRLNFEDAGGAGTAVQGIFMATEPGGPTTTGDLMKLWSGPSSGGPTTAKLWLEASGLLHLPADAQGISLAEDFTIATTVASGTVITPHSTGATNPPTDSRPITFDLSHVNSGIIINPTLSPNVMPNVRFTPINVSGLWEWTGNANALTAFLVNPTINSTVQSSLPFIVFDFAPQINALAATQGIKASSVFVFRPAVINTNDLALGNMSGPSQGFLANPKWLNGALATGSGTVVGIDNFKSFGQFDSTYVMTNATNYWIGYRFRKPTGSGTITHMAALNIDVDGAELVPTNYYSIRSRSATARVQHLGPAVFGADAAPTNASVGIEVQSATLALLVSRLDKAAVVTPVDGMVIYDTVTSKFKGREAGVWQDLYNPPGGVAMTQVELDLGTTPVHEATVNTVDATVNTASKIIWSMSGIAPTGKDEDEIGMDSYTIIPIPRAGSIDWYVRGQEGYIHDKFKLEYVVG
jgi:hypothetical protein